MSCFIEPQKKVVSLNLYMVGKSIVPISKVCNAISPFLYHSFIFSIIIRFRFSTWYQSPRALTSNSILPLPYFKKKNPKSSLPQIFLFSKTDHKNQSLTSRSAKPQLPDQNPSLHALPRAAYGFRKL